MFVFLLSSNQISRVEWQYIGYGNGLLSNRKQNKCNPQVHQHLPFSSYFPNLHMEPMLSQYAPELKLGSGNVSKASTATFSTFATQCNSTRPQLGNLIALSMASLHYKASSTLSCGLEFLCACCRYAGICCSFNWVK